jgi:galactose oxidase-like protein/Big-like domain-containing protein/glyoxal oxidase-like protein/carboxypeptidase family protein
MTLIKHRARTFRCFLAIAALTLLSMSAYAAVQIDAIVNVDRPSASTTIQSPAFSTASANELLLAFVTGDYLSGANTQVSSISGAGLTWQLVVRTNTQSGTSEIWRAFSPSPLTNVTVTATLSQAIVSSMTVMSFAGVDTSGSAGSGAVGAIGSGNSRSGAPTASLTTTRDGSLVLGVGNDYDNAIGRTVGSGQSLIHQYLTPTGDTYWVQMQTAPVPLAGTVVKINDMAPTTDRYNLSIVEVLAAASAGSTYSISGAISPASISSGGTVTLSQNGATVGSAAVDSTGSYVFNNLQNGTYTVTPAKTNVVFAPTSESVTVNGANVTAPAITATAQTWSITGNISPAASGITISLSGASTATTTTDASGNYTFSGLNNGSYTITPSQTGLSFNPVSQTIGINSANVSGVNFTGTSVTWSISGGTNPPLAGATIALSGASTASTTTAADGSYSFSALGNGNYTITPSYPGTAFNPSSLTATINNASITGENFTDQQQSSAPLAVDAKAFGDSSSASTTVTTGAFSTAQPNELLLAFVATDYLSGANTTVSAITGGGLTWAFVRRTNVQSGTAEVWRAFAAGPLSNVTVAATLSQKIYSSISVVSFVGVDVSGTNGSGAIGATASGNATSGAPKVTLTTTRNGSWIFGVGNDFDNAISRTAGTAQTVLHQDLSASGDTYWVQMENSPTALSGTSVTLNDSAPTSDRYNLTAVEVLPAGGGGISSPPSVSMIAPAPATTIAGLVTVAANASSSTSTIASVQFVLDGANLGSPVTAAPYYATWDTTKSTSGAHTLSAIAFDATGLSASSSALTITVDNSGNPAVVGSWSAPSSLNAVAVNLILLPNNKLLYYDDGATPAVWDYQQNVFTATPTNPDLFCSGHASLADGRILVVGGYGDGSGSIGIANAEIFDATNNTWTTVPSMKYKRWYPTATTLSDGRILVTAGWQTGEHTNAGIPEIYNPATNSWTQLTNANNPFETYPFIFLLPDGRIIHVGGSEYATDTDVLDLNTQSWSVLDSRILDGGSAVMYVPNKIMKAGSAADSQMSGPSSNTTFVLDLTQPNPAWQQAPSMAYARTFMNLTSLPDGSVLATGGESDKNGGNIANAVYTAELWSPQTQSWSTMAAMHTPREYHSTALLLPDGRVVESGMGADFGNVPDEQSAEFFSPPYLFKGSRPSISQAPSQIRYGASFTISTPDAANISKAVLIRLGAVTHFFNQNTYYVPVSFQVGAGTLTLTAPIDGRLAPPGYYMLFIVNSNGVPSIAPIVQVGP